MPSPLSPLIHFPTPTVGNLPPGQVAVGRTGPGMPTAIPPPGMGSPDFPITVPGPTIPTNRIPAPLPLPPAKSQWLTRWEIGRNGRHTSKTSEPNRASKPRSWNDIVRTPTITSQPTDVPVDSGFSVASSTKADDSGSSGSGGSFDFSNLPIFALIGLGAFLLLRKKR